MWKCHKCQKPVYFAERQQSLGFDWHPECLRCHECGKRLQPGQHADHKGDPYCHVPCYGALFGPQLFGHGTRVESHKSFGQPKTVAAPKVTNGPVIPRAHIDAKLKTYNNFFDSNSLEVRSRELHGKLVLEGVLRIYWGIQGVIHLKEEDDQRTVVTIRKRNSVRYPNSVDIIRESIVATDQAVAASDNDTTISESLSYDSISISSDVNSLSSSGSGSSSSKETSPIHASNSNTLPSKLDIKKIGWDDIDELLQVERRDDQIRYSTMPSPMTSSMTDSQISNISLDDTSSYKTLSPDGETTSPSSSVYFSQLDSSTDNKVSSADDEDTPTLKPCDFEDFKRQANQEFVNGANEMPSIQDGTLKINQPIDPSRINDSLKLYQDNIMNRSVQSEDGMNVYSLSNSFYIPGQIKSFNIQDTLNLLKNSSSSSSSDDKTLKLEANKILKKSSSMNTSTSSVEDSSWSTDKGISRSKSGPNYAVANFESDTVKPSGKPVIKIKMDCYDELNGSSPPTTPHDDDGTESVVLRKKTKGSTAIKRRSGNRRSRTKIKRRCSINGHFYNRETSIFTPPTGSQMSVYATSLLNSQEIINLVMDKYKIESKAENFALFIIRDNGEQKKLTNEDFPLMTRVLMGPHEDVSKLFLMDAGETQEISPEVAQFVNLSIPECRSIIERYYDEEEREMFRIREK
ncbi:hypothetical protein ACKWTF_013564 [Chironomus riparius]